MFVVILRDIQLDTRKEPYTGSNKLTFSGAAKASLNSARRASFGIRQQTLSKGKRAGEVVKLVALSLALVAGKKGKGQS